MRTDLDRRSILAGLAAASVPIFLPSCAGLAPAAPRLLVLGIDMSASASPEDVEGYLRSADSLIGSMRPSQFADRRDKLVVIPIDDRPMTGKAPPVEATLEASGYADEDIMIDQQREAIRSRLREMPFRSVRTQTRILDTIAYAADLFENSPGFAPLLVLLSDMVEESPILNLDRGPVSSDQFVATVDRLRAQGLAPNLGATIHVSGGAGADAAAYEATKAWWSHYFAACSGQLERYARTPLTFPKSEL